MCMRVSGVVCAHMDADPQGSRGTVGPSGAIVTGGCKPLDMVQEAELGSSVRAIQTLNPRAIFLGVTLAFMREDLSVGRLA